MTSSDIPLGGGRGGIYFQLFTVVFLCADYLRGQPGGGYPPLRSGYDELDTTLMPPRGGLPLPHDQYRNSPSPGLGGAHPGYAGAVQSCGSGSCITLLVL
jgi:hypothetical protein